MLEDDRHLLRILRQQPRRKLHALGGRQEGDEEMVLAGEPVLGGIGQYTAQHAAQRVARQYVVSDMIGGHFRSCRIMLPEIGGDIGSPTPLSTHATPAARRGQQALPPLAEIPAKSRLQGKLKWRLLLPGASEPRLAELNPLGL